LGVGHGLSVRVRFKQECDEYLPRRGGIFIWKKGKNPGFIGKLSDNEPEK
jgi:hypothetical protein